MSALPPSPHPLALGVSALLLFCYDLFPFHSSSLTSPKIEFLWMTIPGEGEVLWGQKIVPKGISPGAEGGFPCVLGGRAVGSDLPFVALTLHLMLTQPDEQKKLVGTLLLFSLKVF